ncbi:hypothetical protein LguiA_012155 [Lonicera macranthoides]
MVMAMVKKTEPKTKPNTSPYYYSPKLRSHKTNQTNNSPNLQAHISPPNPLRSPTGKSPYTSRTNSGTPEQSSSPPIL